MKKIPTKIEGVFLLETTSFQDTRGTFVKTFNEDMFKELGLETQFIESFYSLSRKDVIRGMHFHLPPKTHTKLVYVTQGSALDVVLDLRKNSKTYGDYISVTLSQENNTMVYIPEGCAHGFMSLEDNTCMTYLQTGMYSSLHDSGIDLESFGMEWPTTAPIISKRDKDFCSLKNFTSPF